jgi:hypothetical protein
MLSEELKQQILHSITHPVDRPPGMREQVQAFLCERLGIASYDQPLPVERERGYCWRFCFDAGGKLAPYPMYKTPYEAKRGLSMFRITVSRCGPYVTAESFVTATDDGGATSYFAEERPVSPKAVELAQQAGQRFGLTYLDAAELYAWELEDDVAYEADVDVWEDGWEVPNAFILLF